MLLDRYEKNPIISPDIKKDYEEEAVFNPCSIIHEDKIYLIYRAMGSSNISTLCLAISEDGYNFEKYENNPIIKPGLPEEKQGCEDPRITKIGDFFYLTYTAYDGKHPERSENIYTALAVSKNLVDWEKLGIIAKDIKAAAIFPEKINNKYVMFIGGKKIYLGHSSDLIKWKIDKKPLLDIREDKFDSKYVETGPPPIVHKDFLILFFNTADKKSIFHPSLAILDKDNPYNIIYRADEPLMTPTEEYETKGKVNNVIFGSGLVEFKGKYFYYYGAADKCIAVATVDKTKLEKYVSSLI